METLERIKAEVERLRDTKGIDFNEVVCYANVIRIIERECKIETDTKVRGFTNILGYYTNALEHNSIALKEFDLYKGTTNEQ